VMDKYIYQRVVECFPQKKSLQEPIKYVCVGHFLQNSVNSGKSIAL